MKTPFLFPRNDESPGPAGTSLQGTVERITYVNEKTQYVVARLDVPGRPPATIVGNLPSLTPGETLRVHGAWTSHRKYGDQFAVERYETVTPATLTGIQRYLGSGLIKGIGPIFAQRLVEAFGLDTLRVIDDEPERLREVEGIGPIRIERIRRAWSEQQAVREVMLFLQGHGVSPAYASRIYKTYGQAAVATVQADPYRLARDIAGIGFKTADRIAEKLGIPEDSPLRARAGILYVLQELTEEGHVYALEATLLQRAEANLGISHPLLASALADLARGKQVVVDELPGGRAVYLAALHAAEEQAARRLVGLVRAPHPVRALDAEKALAWVEETTRMALAPEQRAAVRLALARKVLVITGGPGTGKTTILRCILRILERKGLRIHLASPTGRAAKRMAEATGREAATIHRLLEWNPREGGFIRNGLRPLETDLLIVDEASMIDLPLMHHLLQAIPPSATLILVGDADQLPSVGPGAVLKDVLAFEGIPAVRLTQIFRQAEASRIVQNAHRVNRGELPDLSPNPAGEASDFHFLQEEDPERLQQLILDLVSRRIPARYGVDPVEDIQVLTPMHRGAVGAAQLNAVLQARLNPAARDGREVLRSGRVFRVGDRVMQVRNNYEKEVWNGDIGRIAEVDLTEQAVIVAVDGRRVSYDFGELDELTLAYAATVHKSQGSEYPIVVLPIHTTHFPMLQRNLLYTAITRARRLLVLVGTRKAVAIAVKNDAAVNRNSRLGERLHAYLEQETHSP